MFQEKGPTDMSGPSDCDSYNERNFSDRNNILNVPIAKLKSLDESYSGETFLCKELAIQFVSNRSFTECSFPNLEILNIEKGESQSFIHCEFPRLKIIQINDGAEALFLTCYFRSNLKNTLTENYVNSTFKFECEDSAEEDSVEDSVESSVEEDPRPPEKEEDTLQSIIYLLIGGLVGIIIIKFKKIISLGKRLFI